jgi:hypothetical protein
VIARERPYPAEARWPISRARRIPAITSEGAPTVSVDSPDEPRAVAAAVQALLDALEGQPASHEAWMLQVAAGLDHAARMLAFHAPAAPCLRDPARRACAVGGSSEAHVRLLRDVRALRSLVGDPGVRAETSTAGVRRRVLRLTAELLQHGAGTAAPTQQPPRGPGAGGW